MKKLRHIELFAGCGGMSLGLDAAGLKLYFANELSPMAGETFSFNLLGENLEDLSKYGKASEKVLWINSEFEQSNLKARLRENPFAIPTNRISDLNNQSDLEGKLLIGDINCLLEFFQTHPRLLNKIKEADIDLISGGPPCQSFSLAGKREKDNHKNLLPKSFARFAGLVQPKMVLLENVKGITSPFSINDQKFYAWLEVAKAFCLEGFVPICMMINSKYFGIPQNRPRFILYGIRKDVCETLLEKIEDDESICFILDSITFYYKVIENKTRLNNITKEDLGLYDMDKMPDVFNGKLLPPKLNNDNHIVTSADAIGDLLFSKKERIKSEYVLRLNELFKCSAFPLSKISNHDFRNHSNSVKSRFRWFQVLNSLNGLASDGLKLLTADSISVETSDLIFEKIKNHKLAFSENGDLKVRLAHSKKDFLDFLKSIHTKKHSQRAIKANEPAPSQLTIPDDLCHYSPAELRTFTVREMARFQSFPDWFVFRSKITTGGTQRSYEVPQYTQVGNAVPPLLSYEIGKTIKNLLNML